MKNALPLLALLLATACTTTAGRNDVTFSDPPAPAEVSAPAAADPAAEDSRLLAFLDAAFDE
ncbi:MAG TPA: hypothetical protein VGB57_03590, partial [Allosphingosinicella sp.]